MNRTGIWWPYASMGRSSAFITRWEVVWRRQETRGVLLEQSGHLAEQECWLKKRKISFLTAFIDVSVDIRPSA